MKIIQKIKMLFAKPAAAKKDAGGTENETKNATGHKTDSLAYLSYINRKKKGLISGENPAILFGDEWAF